MAAELEVDDDEAVAGAEPQRLAAARAELERRCQDAGFSLREIEGFEENEVGFEVAFPSGRHKRLVPLFSLKSISDFLSIPFEKYIFLNGHLAICSYEDAEVEALIRPLGPGGTPRLLNTLGFRQQAQLDEPDDSEFRILLEAERDDAGPIIAVGPASRTLQILCRRPTRQRLSLTLKKVSATRHDEVLTLVQKVANSLFFQVDLLFNVPMTLERERTYRRLIAKRHRRHTKDDLHYPRMEYDEAPMSLYWYGRGAVGMPLLQFLAYYQVLEFYFATYYQAEARRRIRMILKDPTFRSDRDADLGRILIGIQASGGRISERSQLRATLHECIDGDDLRAFLSDSEEKNAFFSSKTKGLTGKSIPLGNPTAELRSDVADRIYEIRCKIVHSKDGGDGGELEMLLPFSKEAEQLSFDIELIHWLAQKVLVAASSSINL